MKQQVNEASMTEIVKTCRIHGDLTREQVAIYTRKAIKKSTGEPFLQIDCLSCKKEYLINYYRRNKEKLEAYKKEWKKQNEEKVLISRKKSYDKHREKRIALSTRLNKRESWKKYKQEYTKKTRESLSNEYIKKILIGKRKISFKQIPEKLVETKRALLELKRMLRDKAK